MKRTFLLSYLLFGIITLCKSQSGYLDYPSPDTVYTRFFTTYSLASPQDEALLQFQKKPDGWHVVQFLGGYDSIVKDELFWSRASRSFQKIHFDPMTDGNSANQSINYFTQSFNTTFFRFFPYYNYRGFDWDVIQDYKDKKNLPDSVLYALGRSYSFFADNLLNNNSGLSDKRFRFKLNEGQNCLSPDQLKEYNKFHNLAIETFKEVKQLNPKYETMVGDIGMKLDNEYMVGYLDMLLYQNEEQANKELPDNLYDYFIISVAKDYLASCDPNAILVTFGDNDTYPLLYVQAKYKYRTDVLVVNNELISLSRYINRLRLPFIGAEPLPLSLTPDKYKDGTREYILYYNNPQLNLPPDKSFQLGKAMNFMLSDDTTEKVQMSDGSYMNYLPSKELTFAVNKENVRRSGILSNAESKNMVDELRWKYNGGYILKGKLILLNTLIANDWKRPICFTNGEDEAYMGLEKYLRLQGTVYELVPIENLSSTPLLNPTISSDKMYDLVMHKFMWGNIPDDRNIEATKCQMAANFRISISKLAYQLLGENKKDLALKVLNRCMDSVPATKCPYDVFAIYMVDCYYKAGDSAKANTISAKLFDLSEQKLTACTKGANLSPEEAFSGTNKNITSLFTQTLQVLNELIVYANDNHQTPMVDAYNKRLQALYNNGVIDKEMMDGMTK